MIEIAAGVVLGGIALAVLYAALCFALWILVVIVEVLRGY